MQIITPGRSWLDAGPKRSDDPIDDVPDDAYALAVKIIADHRASGADPLSFPPTVLYSGGNSDRQCVGLPGHCSVCAIIGHVLAHPELGCSDVQCNSVHDAPARHGAKINKPASRQAVRRTEPVWRTGTDAPTGAPDESFFAYDMSTGSRGLPYAAHRFGLTVVETFGSEPVRYATAPDIATARGWFAESTCDPEGVGAPRPGDLIDLYEPGSPLAVETVEPHLAGGFSITLAGRRKSVRVVAGTFAIVARPA